MGSSVVTVHPSPTQLVQVPMVSVTIAVVSAIPQGRVLSPLVELLPAPHLSFNGDIVSTDLRGLMDLLHEHREVADCLAA